MLWKDFVQVQLIEAIDQSKTSWVEFNSKKFILNVIYGYNEGYDRKKLWTHLRSIHNSVSNGPWLLAGDFNIIADTSESSPFNSFYATSNDMRDFEDVRNNIFVYDHAFISPLFTWTNKHQKGFMARKLDRVMINDACHLVLHIVWLNFFHQKCRIIVQL